MVACGHAVVEKFGVERPPEEATEKPARRAVAWLAKARSMVALAPKGSSVAPPPSAVAPPCAAEPLPADSSPFEFREYH